MPANILFSQCFGRSKDLDRLLRTSASIVVFALFFGFSFQANAATIFDSLGPLNDFADERLIGLDEFPTFSTDIGGVAGRTDFEDREWAWSFNVTSTATVSSVEVALSLVSGENEVDLWIATDDSGVPGTIIDLMHLSGAIGAGSVVSAASTSNPILTPGTYYFGVSAGEMGVGGFNNGNSVSSRVGIHESKVATGTNFNLLDEGTLAAPLDTWFAFSTGDIAAFRINAVPIPAAAWMGLAMLGGLAAVRTARRRRSVA